MKKLLSVILSITMLLSMATIAFADEIASDAPDNVSTFDELTQISAKEIKKISIGCSKSGLGLSEFSTSSPSAIANIINVVKDIQFVEDTRGSAGGWSYGINFYMEDESYIQFGTRLHIDKIDYIALEHNNTTEIMKKYHDLFESINNNEWATDYILDGISLGLLDGISELNYQENITREEFCKLIYNLIVLASDEITAPVTDSFTDTKNNKILMLNGLGIINGKSETEFAPNDYLTREEAATIIIRMVNKVFPMAETEMWLEYDDIDEISEWASNFVQTISNLGFMKGVGNNKFAPKDTYTTQQAIVTLVRVFERATADGLLDKNTSIGIIGGADTPTQITITDTKKAVSFKNLCV